MKVRDQIKAALLQRKEVIDQMEALVGKSESEDRPLTEEEDKTFKELQVKVSDNDARVKRLEDLEQLVSANAKAVIVEDENDAAAAAEKQTNSFAFGIQKDTKRKKVKGGFFARQAHLLYVAGGNPLVAADYAERSGDKEMGAVLRATAGAADSTTTAWAGALVQQETQDFIDLLRPMSVYSRIPAGSTVSFDGTNSIKLPKMTTGTPGGWVSEEGAIPVKEGAFTSITITPSKLGVITVATREVLARSTPALETILRDAMLRDTAITLDRRFLSSSAAGSGAPSGLFHTDNAPAAITASALSNAVDDAVADLSAMQTAMYTANVPMNNLVWIMHSSKRLALASMRIATGVFMFRDELATGTLAGIPVIDSAVFDFGVNNGSSTQPDAVALVDASLLVKGEGIAPTIRMSEDATLHMSDAPDTDLGGGGTATPVRSLFQTDCAALRLIWETTWRMRHTVGVQYIANVAW